MQDASSDTNVKLHFRTSKPDGLLLLAAGSIDYCIVSLQAGAVTVRIDLGSGDVTLVSPRTAGTFSDLRWHSVHLKRTQARLELIVDELYTTSAVSPGRFYELNIDKAIFAGGTGGSERSERFVFFGNYETFRGCLRGVSFNGRDVLRLARDSPSLEAGYGVTWNCSTEFDVSSSEPISFIQDMSYVSFPPIKAQPIVRIVFDLRTLSQNAIVIFYSGSRPSSDYLTVELVNGELKFQVGNGNGVSVVNAEMLVSDGEWHHVEVSVTGSTVGLTVDEDHLEKVRNVGFSRTLNISFPLYLGGIDGVMSPIVMGRKLESLAARIVSNDQQKSANDGSSLVGCVKNLRINGVITGFREVDTSRSVAPGCVWGDRCASDPCTGGATCVKKGLGSFECVCRRPNCDVDQPDVDDTLTSDVVHDILVVRDLTVVEGNKSMITEANIFVKTNHRDFDIDDTSVIFRVVNPPTKGEVFVDTEESVQSSDVIFSLSDMNAGRVWYLHDRSETVADSIGLELQFVTSTTEEDVPEKFTRKYGFTVMIRITDVNDKPHFELLEGGVLTMVPNAQVKITQSILKATDLDNSPAELEFTVQYTQGTEGGYFETFDSLGARVRTSQFTQSDVDEDKVRYVHRGASHQQVTIQVSDGKDVSEAQTLVISALPLRLILVSKTDLSAPRGSVKLITRDNLAFSTNTVHQDYEVRYEVVEDPTEGEIQRYQISDNQWAKVSSFTQKHVDRNRIRYSHSFHDAVSGEDGFKFKVSTKGTHSQEHAFKINIVDVRVSLTRNTGLLLLDVRERAITSDELMAVSTVTDHKPIDIYYQLISMPRKGHLVRLEHGSLQRRTLSLGTNFTQADVNEKRVVYRLQKALSSKITDDFEFRLLVPGLTSVIGMFELKFEPVLGDVRFINNGIVDVIEGDRKVITSEDLSTVKRGARDFRYTIIGYAQHGTIQLVDARTGAVTHENVSSFTNENIQNLQVYYAHDGSETNEDAFRFISTPVIDKSETGIQEIKEFSGRFDVRIMLNNDNPPQRIVEKPFKVVADQGRMVLPEDLSYVDPDVNYDSQLLQYDIGHISNGAVVLNDSRSVAIYRFKQSDITEGRIYFKHHGGPTSRTVVNVTDGRYVTSGVFEVQASDAYVRVSNLSSLIVERGRNVVVLPESLNFETNLEVDDAKVKFVVLEPPKSGTLHQNEPSFSLADLKSGSVTYEHRDGSNLMDDFKFLVRVDHVQSRGVVHIQVLLDGQQHPPKIEKNRPAVVYELESLAITVDLLNVSHPVAGARDVRYTVTAHPQHGKLSLVDTREGGRELVAFTQEDVNLGRLHYEHNDEGELTDTFQFDVHCGVSMLNGLKFVLDVVPSVIPLAISDLTVAENGRVILTPDMLQVANRHYAAQDIEFLVMKEPSHGRIEITDRTGVKVSQFTLDRVQRRQIQYAHDGEETRVDAFMIMGKLSAREKQSDITSVKVVITPTNDQPPRVVLNRKMVIWTGE